MVKRCHQASCKPLREQQPCSSGAHVNAGGSCSLAARRRVLKRIELAELRKLDAMLPPALRMRRRSRVQPTSAGRVHSSKAELTSAEHTLRDTVAYIHVLERAVMARVAAGTLPSDALANLQSMKLPLPDGGAVQQHSANVSDKFISAAHVKQ